MMVIEEETMKKKRSSLNNRCQLQTLLKLQRYYDTTWNHMDQKKLHEDVWNDRKLRRTNWSPLYLTLNYRAWDAVPPFRMPGYAWNTIRRESLRLTIRVLPQGSSPCKKDDWGSPTWLMIARESLASDAGWNGPLIPTKIRKQPFNSTRLNVLWPTVPQ